MTEKQKNEHSVLISLDSMAEDEGQAAGQVNTAGAESGLIDIGALENAGLLDDAGESVDLPIEATAPSSASQVKDPVPPGPPLLIPWPSWATFVLEAMSLRSDAGGPTT